LRVSYLVILGLIISFSLGANFSFAQTNYEPGLTIRTNDGIYEVGDTITILGTVTTVNEDIDIIIQLWKDGDIINVKQMQPDVNGDYSYTLLAEGPKWTEGAYVFRATYGQGIAEETIFSLRHFESFEQSESTESSITVQMNGPSTFYLDVPHQIIRATVEFQDYHPSDGFSFMKVTHLPTNIVLKDFEIYPKPSGNNMWAVQVAYPILESDIKVGGQALLGEYEIHIRTEYGSQTGSTTFSILESGGDSTVLQPKSEPTKSDPKVSIEAIANSSFYEEGQTIAVTGKVSEIVFGNAISLRVIAPNGNVIFLDQIFLDSQGLFIYNLDTNRNLFKQNGDYTIQLIYGSEDIYKNIFFTYKNEEIITPEPIPEVEPPIPKVEETIPEVKEPIPEVKVSEKNNEKIIQPADQKNEESNQESEYILLALGIIIVGIIIGIIVIKKRPKSKDQLVSDDYIYETKKKKDEEKMKWEGI